MMKVAIVFTIIGAVLYFGSSIVENIIKKKNTKEEEE